jgi:hypothetical protein
MALSVLLNRGVNEVEKDMDFGGALIGMCDVYMMFNFMFFSDEHWYCTQEMVNLMILGRASGQVMDDDDSSKLLSSMFCRRLCECHCFIYLFSVKQMFLYFHLRPESWTSKAWPTVPMLASFLSLRPMGI